MALVKFVADFDWAPPKLKGRYVLAFKAGTVATVTHDCAQQAIAAGKAIDAEQSRATTRKSRV